MAEGVDRDFLEKFKAKTIVAMEAMKQIELMAPEIAILVRRLIDERMPVFQHHARAMRDGRMGWFIVQEYKGYNVWILEDGRIAIESTDSTGRSEITAIGDLEFAKIHRADVFLRRLTISLMAPESDAVQATSTRTSQRSESCA